MDELQQGNNIDKAKFCQLVHNRLKERGYEIELSDIQNVITIFIEEMQLLLLSGKSFFIRGLGRFRIKKMPPRPHYNFKIREVETKPIQRNKILFILTRRLKRLLLDNLDVERTFTETQNEKTT